jgi:ribosomal protein L31
MASARHTSKRLQQDIHPNGFSKTYIQTASATYTFKRLQPDIHPNGFSKTFIQTALIQTALIQTAFSKTYIHTAHSKFESTILSQNPHYVASSGMLIFLLNVYSMNPTAL